MRVYKLVHTATLPALNQCSLIQSSHLTSSNQYVSSVILYTNKFLTEIWFCSNAFLWFCCQLVWYKWFHGNKLCYIHEDGNSCMIDCTNTLTFGHIYLEIYQKMWHGFTMYSNNKTTAVPGASAVNRCQHFHRQIVNLFVHQKINYKITRGHVMKPCHDVTATKPLMIISPTSISWPTDDRHHSEASHWGRCNVLTGGYQTYCQSVA